MARAYLKFLSEASYFLLFQILKRVSQIGRKQMGGPGPFKLGILLINWYVKWTLNFILFVLYGHMKQRLFKKKVLKISWL